MTQEFYYQCTFSKGNHRTIAWIPEEAAKVGNEVELLSLDGEFWRVTGVGHKLTKEEVKDNERNNREFQHSIK